MKMQDLIDKKMVQVRPHPTLPLSLYRYHKKVFWKGLFSEDERLRFARGLGLHDDGRIIVRPFFKVYNLHEADAGHNWKDDHPVLIERKVNGFMACVTRYDGELIYSTTGTFDSDFVKLAQRYIEDQIDTYRLFPGRTYIFEICAEEDPHIIEEEIGVYLIGIMPNDEYPKYSDCEPLPYSLFGEANYYHPWHMVDAWHSSRDCILYHQQLAGLAEEMGSYRVEKHIVSFGDAKKKVKECDHEGFMMTNLSGEVDLHEEVIKVKSPLYLSTKFFARYKRKGNEELSVMKKRVDEEYYPLLEKVFNEDQDFFELEEQDRIQYVRDWATENLS